MKSLLQNLDRFMQRYWLTSSIVGISIILATSALAEYQKPTTTSAPNSETTTSTATRGGCLAQEDSNLTAIAPYSHVGQTASTYPTFAWFVPDAENFPLEFYLEQYTANSQLETIYQQKLSSKPGIMSLSLPQDSPGLTVGQKYRWKIVMRCTRYRAVVTMAEIEVVAPSSKAKTAFNKVTGTSQQANFLAEMGLWYDALGTTFDADFQQWQLQSQLIQELAAVEEKYSNFSEVRRQAEKLIAISDRLQ